MRRVWNFVQDIVALIIIIPYVVVIDVFRKNEVSAKRLNVGQMIVIGGTIVTVRDWTDGGHEIILGVEDAQGGPALLTMNPNDMVELS